MSGKRKRRSRAMSNEAELYTKTYTDTTDTTAPEDLQTLFRQHFEANFEPLEGLSCRSIKVHSNDAEPPEVQSDSEWDGFSEADETPTEVIYSNLSAGKVKAPREEVKTFMTSKPPSFIKTHAAAAPSKPLGLTDEDAVTDAANLKKDLTLQRLLRESHLLDSQSTFSLGGSNRHKAVDLRLQDMGSKSSIFKQDNMPLAQRKGIHAKSVERDVLRRRQAQENGIILEKAVRGKDKHTGKRQKGIGAPNVGIFQGGMLKLSQKDVAVIEGPKKSSRGRR